MRHSSSCSSGKLILRLSQHSVRGSSLVLHDQLLRDRAHDGQQARRVVHRHEQGLHLVLRDLALDARHLRVHRAHVPHDASAFAALPQGASLQASKRAISIQFRPGTEA